MTIQKTISQDKTILTVEGRIDTKTAQEFQSAVDEVIASADIHLELNFKLVDYLSSAGLRALLYAQKKISTFQNSFLSIVDVQEEVMEVLNMTGFTDFMSITPAQ